MLLKTSKFKILANTSKFLLSGLILAVSMNLSAENINQVKEESTITNSEMISQNNGGEFWKIIEDEIRMEKEMSIELTNDTKTNDNLIENKINIAFEEFDKEMLRTAKKAFNYNENSSVDKNDVQIIINSGFEENIKNFDNKMKKILNDIELNTEYKLNEKGIKLSNSEMMKSISIMKEELKKQVTNEFRSNLKAMKKFNKSIKDKIENNKNILELS